MVSPAFVQPAKALQCSKIWAEKGRGRLSFQRSSPSRRITFLRSFPPQKNKFQLPKIRIVFVLSLNAVKFEGRNRLMFANPDQLYPFSMSLFRLILKNLLKYYFSIKIFR